MFIYVNNILLLSLIIKTINSLKQKLNDIYKMTDCKLYKYYLDIKIK